MIQTYSCDEAVQKIFDSAFKAGKENGVPFEIVCSKTTFFLMEVLNVTPESIDKYFYDRLVQHIEDFKS